MKCPYCSANATKELSTEGYDMYVAEDTECSTECADGDISFFRCNENKKHIFYADDLNGNKNQ